MTSEIGTQTDAAGSPALLANRCARFTCTYRRRLHHEPCTTYWLRHRRHVCVCVLDRDQTRHPGQPTTTISASPVLWFTGLNMGVGSCIPYVQTGGCRWRAWSRSSHARPSCMATAMSQHRAPAGGSSRLLRRVYGRYAGGYGRHA
jgi:hypothetical protein